METDRAVELLECGATMDRQAVLGKLFAQYLSRLHAAVTYRMNGRLHRRFGPGDVIQETYMEAQRRVDEYCANPAVPLYVWLRTLALQKLKELERRHLRAKKRDARREVSLDGSSPGIPVAAASPAVDTPSQIVMRKERDDLFRDVLEGLDEDDRELIICKCFERATWAEVSTALGVEEVTLRKRYSRALQRLKEALRGAAQDRSGFWRS